jgi:hypothetical protein
MFYLYKLSLALLYYNGLVVLEDFEIIPIEAVKGQI